jgi:hypothetical protein
MHSVAPPARQPMIKVDGFSTPELIWAAASLVLCIPLAVLNLAHVINWPWQRVFAPCLWTYVAIVVVLIAMRVAELITLVRHNRANRPPI